MIRIIPGDFGDPRVTGLLQHHFTTCHAVTPKGSAHAVDLSGLQLPEVNFWAAWEGDTLLGIGALKRIAPGHGEVKSMHTAEAARRRGIAGAMLRHIIADAQSQGLSRLSLETGSFDYFRPAVALYRAHGFVDCQPFGSYRPDPNSVFLTLDLSCA
jgi:putative acetyltransferase